MYDEYIRKDDQRRGTDCLDQTIDQLFPQNVDGIIHYAHSANSYVRKFVVFFLTNLDQISLDSREKKVKNTVETDANCSNYFNVITLVEEGVVRLS